MKYMQYISVTGDEDGVIRRSVAIAPTNDLAAGDSFYAPSDENFWRIDDEPVVPSTEDIENSSIYYEPENGYWYLFTNHVYDNSYTNAVWVYWTKDPDRWRVEDKAIVLDKSNCTWAKGAIGMPTVVKADDNTLVMVYDGVDGDGTGHLNRKIGLATIKLPLYPNTFVGSENPGHLQCQTE
jgi:hypothetical protein